MFLHEQIFEYFCHQCDKSFSSRINLDHHIRTNHTKRTIHCQICDKAFVDKNMLDEHISSKHSLRSQTEKQLVCPVCKKLYNRSTRLKKHMTTHERLQKNNVLTCNQCSMAFATIEDVDEHFNHQHDDDNNTSTVNITKKELLFVVCCEYCEDAFIDNTKLLKHKQCHSNEKNPFKCEFCMACYETYSKLKTHKNTHINQQIKFPVQRHYMCDVENCWKRYRHWSDLSIHRKTVHLINPSIYKCSECEQTFYQSWKFSYHKKTVHALSSVKCDVCSIECPNVYNLKFHKKKHHSPATNLIRNKIATTSNVRQPKKIITTKIEKNSFNFDQYLKKSKTAAIICNLCDKQLANRNSAKSHIEMIHLKIKNHLCNECGKEFYLRKDYNDHLRLHTSETPYQCQLCPKKFRTASAVNDHRK